LGISPDGEFIKQLWTGKNLAERVGFEPTVPFGITDFQDLLHKPLGHLSIRYAILLYHHFSGIKLAESLKSVKEVLITTPTSRGSNTKKAFN
jgi:hypothetical protein